MSGETYVEKTGNIIVHHPIKRTALKTFYVTFGVKYRDKQHPHPIGGVHPHPDGWFEIRRTTYDQAHEDAMRAFGGRFAFLYPEDHWEPHWYPLGKLGEVK